MDSSRLLAAVSFDAQGLVPAVAQDALTGEVRMVAYMNREALELTVRDGAAWFYSRSRNKLWKKGESSGNVLHVQSVHLDCDGDCVVLLVDPTGPSCHTGAKSCFYRSWDASEEQWKDSSLSFPLLERLEAALEARKNTTEERSYTRSLLTAGAGKIGAKLREEADELARALESESDDRVLSEAADVLYHLLVGLRLRNLPWRGVLQVLAKRFGVGGLVEKAQRAPQNKT